MMRGLTVALCYLVVLAAAPAIAQEPIASIKIHYDANPPYTVINVGYTVKPSEAMDAAFTPGGMADIANKARAYEGQSVQIHIPAELQYGSGGAFSNVRITSGNGGVTLDPNAIVESNETVYTGSVSISTFTRDVLEGSYSGNLYKIERLNHEPWRKAVSMGSVSGSFRAGMPDLTDDRFAHDPPESEKARAQNSALWDAMRIAGIRFDDEEGMSRFFADGGPDVLGGDGSGSGGGGGAAGAEACVCECDVLIALPEDHQCVAPGGDCHLGLQLCKEHGLGGEAEVVDQPGSAEVEQLIDLLGGKNAPAATRNALREEIEALSEEERQQLLLTLTDPDAAAAHALETREADPVDPGAGAQYDAETLQYQQLVEQLGLPEDITAEAVEMFYQNEAPMREQLWKNVREQLEQRNQ